MNLHFLGTTGYHPSRQRQTACLMLPEIGVVLDAGTGLLRARDLIATEELSIFLTHAHLDHSIGLTFLFDVLHEKPVRKTTVYGEADKIAAIREHLFSPLLFPALPPITFAALLLGVPVDLLGGGVLRHFPLAHPGGALGFRIELPGASLAYVTDTTAALDAEYLSHIQGVDLLVHECYFPDGFGDRASLTGHSCLGSVAQVARAVAARRLALVHLNPLEDAGMRLDLDSIRPIFPDVFLPVDGQLVEFGHE
jgi:ribonuclease BN (tRNA processing enzyme)